LPQSVAATTVDSQCGSSQQALALAASLIGSGSIDVAIACGVENMSLIPIGASTEAGPGRALTRRYFEHYEFISQFEAGERIAENWGISREECDELGLMSQQRAARAWDEGRMKSEVIGVPVQHTNEAGDDEIVVHVRDEGLRETSMEALRQLKPVVRADGVHTAGNSSQIADQASAVLLVAADRLESLGLHGRAVVVDHCLVGVDPVMMLTGPIDATQHLLRKNGLTMSDMDLVEINEAFASVVLSWARELEPDMERVNVNGGAIAIGHALGSTGTRLIGAAVNELERSGGRRALVTMCCGGGLGTGTLLEVC
jgi:acetyl-CoA C-acetyltransferase